MSITSGQITGLLSAAATVAGLFGFTGVATFLSDPHLAGALLAFGALLAPLAGHLPGASRPEPALTKS